MAPQIPPPQERFDIITQRWITPGGPLSDPERTSVDPGGQEPVTLVGPLPPELTEPGPPSAVGPEGRPGRTGPTPTQLLRWALVVIVLLALIAIVVGWFVAARV